MAAFDVVIVGGGVIGSAIAYHLMADPAFKGTLAVIERDPMYTTASSSLSTSAIRQQFGTAANIAMSAYGIEFLRRVRTELAVDGHDADIGLREPGYLILGRPDQVAGFEARHAVQRGCGVKTELLDVAALRRRFPWLSTEGLGIGSFGLEGEGWFDGPALLQAFRRKARALGAQYIADEVVGIERHAGDVAAVRLEKMGRVACGTVVNAAGPWSGAVAGMAGLELPVAPRKRCVFVIESPARLDAAGPAPFVFDASGFFVRPEGHLYICGAPPPFENADDDFGLEVDHALFEEVIWPALADRIPGFEQVRQLRAWAGLYEHNAFDHSAVIGRHPEVTNLVFACGFSGHGMMHSPAAGVAVAELIVHGHARSVDITPFGFERIAAGRPIPEHVY